MSRNSKRVSSAAETPEINPPSAPDPRDTATRTSTTEAVPLPSRGLFYPPGHPLCGEEYIEIRYMTARDEDILTSPSLLKNGTALDKFTQGLICDPRIKIDDLLVGDKSAIMIAARITGYGPDYDVVVTCPECGEESDHTFDLSDYEKYYTTVGDTVEGFYLNGNNRYEVVLPASGYTVELKMATSRDEQRLNRSQKMKAKNKLAETNSTDFLKLVIHSIDGDIDRNNISQKVMDLPARDSRFLRKHFPEVSPNLDLKETFECQYCGTETEMEVPLEAGFFWPDS